MPSETAVHVIPARSLPLDDRTLHHLRNVAHDARRGGETTPVPGHKVMQHAGRMVRFCAEALDRTLGQSGGAR